MSWASRRRTAYISGILIFFLVVVGGPVAWWWYSSTPPICPSGYLRPEGQSGGPCYFRDEHLLSPFSVLWSRSFTAHAGTYTAIAYLQNPNTDVGVQRVGYKFGLYDTDNILVAERTGQTYIMPGGVTPVLEANIDTGNREVVHTFFSTTTMLIWQDMENTTRVLRVRVDPMENQDTSPRVQATITNTGVADLTDPEFTAVVFNLDGNAIEASGSKIPLLAAGQSQTLVFTWPTAFSEAVGHVEVLPLLPPALKSLPPH